MKFNDIRNAIFIEEDQLQREGDFFTKSLWDKVRMTKNNAVEVSTFQRLL